MADTPTTQDILDHLNNPDRWGDEPPYGGAYEEAKTLEWTVEMAEHDPASDPHADIPLVTGHVAAFSPTQARWIDWGTWDACGYWVKGVGTPPVKPVAPEPIDVRIEPHRRVEVVKAAVHGPAPEEDPWAALAERVQGFDVGRHRDLLKMLPSDKRPEEGTQAGKAATVDAFRSVGWAAHDLECALALCDQLAEVHAAAHRAVEWARALKARTTTRANPKVVQALSDALLRALAGETAQVVVVEEDADGDDCRSAWAGQDALSVERLLGGLELVKASIVADVLGLGRGDL